MLSRVLRCFHVLSRFSVNSSQCSVICYCLDWYLFSSHTGYIHSNQAFLFSLKNGLNNQYKMIAYRNQHRAMYSENRWGPSFGVNGDLALADRCDVITDSFSYLGGTYKPPNGFTAYSPEANSLLAGSENFKCNEYEVFIQN